MALTVETGAGLANAESYASVVEADTYHASLGNTAWAASTVTNEAKEIALRQATQYLDRVYGRRFKGERYTKTQALRWPREDVEDPEGDELTPTTLPPALKSACIELALRALAADLVPDIAAPATIANESVSVGPISLSTGYAGPKSQITRYREVDLLLGDLVYAAGEIIRS